MNRNLYLAMAAVALAGTLAACSSDEPAIGNATGVDGIVAFTIQAPTGTNSRAAGDGNSCDYIKYAVYDADAADAFLFQDSLPVTFVDHETTVEIQLVNNKKYRVAFFAMNQAAPYTLHEGVLNVDYSSLEANSDIYDAFYNVTQEITVTTGMTKPSVTLHRPFAQVNVGASDWQTAKKLGLEVQETSMTFSAEVPHTMNLLDGEVGTDLVAVEYPMGTIHDLTAGVPSTLTVAAKDYSWVAMNYVLASRSGSTVNTVTFDYAGRKAAQAVEVLSVPVRQNFRTNIVGTFFTTAVSYEIIIDADPSGSIDKTILNGKWTDKTEAPTVNSSTGALEVSTPEQLAYIAEQVNSGAETYLDKTITLTADIDLSGKAWTPIGTFTGLDQTDYSKVFQGTFKGNGHTIKNMTVDITATSADRPVSAGLFGAFYGSNWFKDYGVYDVTIEGANISVSGTDQAYVGGLIGVSFGNYGGSSISGNRYNNVSGVTIKDCTITSSACAGGLIGLNGVGSAPKGCTISGCTIKSTATSWSGNLDFTPTGGIIEWYIASVEAEEGRQLTDAEKEQYKSMFTTPYEYDQEDYEFLAQMYLFVQLIEQPYAAAAIVGITSGASDIYPCTVTDCTVDGYFVGGITAAAFDTPQWIPGGTTISNSNFTCSAILKKVWWYHGKYASYGLPPAGWYDLTSDYCEDYGLGNFKYLGSMVQLEFANESTSANMPTVTACTYTIR